MPFVLVIVGAILVVTAFNNSHGSLGQALQTDLPGYFKWGAAIAAILGLGYVPGLKTASRWLLALVLLVIVLKNYSGIFAGFTSFAKSGPAATDAGPDIATPSAAFSASAGQSTAAANIAAVAGEVGDSSATSSSSILDLGSAGQVTFSPPAWLSGLFSRGGLTQLLRPGA